MLKLFVLLLSCYSLHAQSLLLMGAGKGGSGGGGGGGALVGSVLTAKSTNQTVATTAGEDTSGATMTTIVCIESVAVATTATDSKGNTYTAGAVDANNGWAIRMYYANASTGTFTVGSGHTFTCTVSGVLISVAAAAFSGVITGAPTDGAGTAHDTAGNSATCLPGSITPSQTGDVFFSAAGNTDANNTSLSIDLSFTAGTTRVSDSNGTGINAAYLVLAGAGATSPTWTSNYAGNWQKCAQMAFKTH